MTSNPRTKVTAALFGFAALGVLSVLLPAVATALTVLTITLLGVGGVTAIGVLIEFNLPRRLGEKPQPPGSQPDRSAAP